MNISRPMLAQTMALVAGWASVFRTVSISSSYVIIKYMLVEAIVVNTNEMNLNPSRTSNSLLSQGLHLVPQRWWYMCSKLKECTNSINEPLLNTLFCVGSGITYSRLEFWDTPNELSCWLTPVDLERFWEIVDCTPNWDCTPNCGCYGKILFFLISGL